MPDVLIIPGLIVLIVCVVALLARSRSKSGNKAQRGCAPGQGDQVIDTSYGSGGLGGGHGDVTRVTRDPQKYARAFVPRSARKTRR